MHQKAFRPFSILQVRGNHFRHFRIKVFVTVLTIYNKPYWKLTGCSSALKTRKYKPWRGTQLHPVEKGECKYEVLPSQSPGEEKDAVPGG